MKEWELQKECFRWFVNEYPAHSKLLCYNMNNANSHVQGAKYKSIGLQAGRSDMVLYFNGAATMIEFKIDSGEQSQAQKDWELAVKIQGFEYYVVRSFEWFKSLIKIIIVTAPLHGLSSREYIEQYLE